MASISTRGETGDKFAELETLKMHYGLRGCKRRRADAEWKNAEC